MPNPYHTRNSRGKGHLFVLVALVGAVLIGIALGTLVPRSAEKGTSSAGGSGGSGAGLPTSSPTTGGGGIVDEPQIDPALIDISEAHVDFAEVWPNETVRRTVRVHNRSDVDVRLLDATTSCNCLESTYESDVIPAGGSLDITHELVVPDRQNMPLRFDTTLRLANAEQPYRIFITARSREVFTFEPAFDEIETIVGVVVRAADDEIFTALRLPPFMRMVSNAGEPAREIAFEFTSAERGVDRFTTQLPILALEHPLHGIISIDWQEPFALPKWGSPTVVPHPPSVRISIEQATQGYEFEVVLEGPTAREADQLGVLENPFRNVEVRIVGIEPVAEGARLRLFVQHGGEPNRWLGGTIIFTFDGRPAATVDLIATVQ